jgi:hypothetical protein
MLSARLFLSVATVLSLCVVVNGAKKWIDPNALREEWLDDDIDDEEWHEDTFDWREKMREKKKANTKFDAKDPMSFMGNMNKGMQMSFGYLKEKPGRTQSDTEELAKMWQSTCGVWGVKRCAVVNLVDDVTQVS